MQLRRAIYLWACSGLLISGFCARAQEIDLTASVAWAKSGKSTHGGVFKDVVLWLTPLQTSVPAVPAVRKSGMQLVQRNKSFEPHVMVVPVGSVVEFPNRDPFFHNVFSLFEGKRFDLGLYEAGSMRNVHFDKPGVSYIFCNIHPEMSAVVIALQTPYYAVSDDRGKLRIPHLPVGHYRLHLWYAAALPEELNAMTREISVTEKTSSLGVLTLKVAEVPKTHQNKYGQEYEPPNPGSPAYIRP